MSQILLTDALRREYDSNQLLEKNILKDPFAEFNIWLAEAISFPVKLPDAMTLATANEDGIPDARIVLLKELNASGLTFFTNYNSQKGQHLQKNSSAACVFWWPELEKQIRIRGKVDPISQEDSEQYFKKRPRGSQLAAHASPQSEVISNREWLEEKLESVRQSFENKEVTKPLHWGGYCLTPHTFEFWQGRVNRLHDRLRYRLDQNGIWVIERLAP